MLDRVGLGFWLSAVWVEHIDIELMDWIELRWLAREPVIECLGTKIGA